MSFAYTGTRTETAGDETSTTKNYNQWWFLNQWNGLLTSSSSIWGFYITKVGDSYYPVVSAHIDNAWPSSQILYDAKLTVSDDIEESDSFTVSWSYTDDVSTDDAVARTTYALSLTFKKADAE